MNRKERIKFLEKLAQTQGSQTNAPSAQRSPSVSTLFPSIAIGWDSSRVPYINRIVSLLDAAIGGGTNGKYNFKILWDQKFPSGASSEFTSPIKDLLILLNKIYLQFLNNGVPFQKPLNAGEVKQRINIILGSPEISKLEEINPIGSIGQAGVSLYSVRQYLINMLPATGAK